MTNVIDHSREIAAAIRKAFSEFPRASSVNDKLTPFTWLLNCLVIDGVITTDDLMTAHADLDDPPPKMECPGTVVYGVFPQAAAGRVQ